MTERIGELITITGPRGVGKTTLAATYKPPSKLGEVIYFDTEKSANHFRSQLRDGGLGDFGGYVDLQDMFGGLPEDDDLLDRLNKGEVPWVSTEQRNALIGYYNYLLKAFAEIPRNKYRVLVLDTIEKFEAGMAAFVEANKGKFGIGSTAYGKLWTEGVFPLYENLLQGLWGRGIETVIFTSHLKNVWEGSRPVPGKVAMSGKKVLYRLSSLMLWLVHDSGNSRGEPAGLVLKERQARIGVVNDEWDIQRTLPPRVPTCTWKEIRRYLKDGYDVANPKKEEKRSASENEMISELLTDAQTALMLSDARQKEQENSILMAQSGLLPTVGGSTILIGDESEDKSTDIPQPTQVNKPRTRAEAIQWWTGMGRPVPELLRKLIGVEEGEIEGKWDEISGNGGNEE